MNIEISSTELTMVVHSQYYQRYGIHIDVNYTGIIQFVHATYCSMTND